jgi:hypothetical protein
MSLDAHTPYTRGKQGGVNIREAQRLSSGETKVSMSRNYKGRETISFDAVRSQVAPHVAEEEAPRAGRL